MKKYPYYIGGLLCLVMFSFKNINSKNSDSLKNYFRDTLIVSYDTIRDYDETIQTEPQFFYENYTWQTYLLSHINSHIPVRKDIPMGSFLYVLVSFTVTKEGSIDYLRISIPNVENDIINIMTKEIIRFFKNCPLWIPATMNGRSVPYRMKQRIFFKADLEQIEPIIEPKLPAKTTPSTFHPHNLSQ